MRITPKLEIHFEWTESEEEHKRLLKLAADATAALRKEFRLAVSFAMFGSGLIKRLKRR